jgi:hypothetical protein
VFKREYAAAAPRKGGRSVAARYGTEHMAEIGRRRGFAALTRKLGYMGRFRRAALVRLQHRGQFHNLDPNPTAAIAWAEAAAEPAPASEVWGRRLTSRDSRP